MALFTIKFVPFNVHINDCSGSGAHRDLVTWKPHLETGWFYLGPSATNNREGGPIGLIIKPGEDWFLADIDHWERVWDNSDQDSGPGRPSDYALWRGFPKNRADFVVVGGFFTRSHDPPSAELTKGMKAIHKDVLITVNAGDQIWTDAGTRASNDGSVWNISTDGNLQAVDTGAFVAKNNRHTPPLATYALNRGKVNYRP